jgi:transcriptional regulator with PAS, ATPase and Fis domain
VFLDEIADMPLMLQAKLLRVLQERQVMRIGSEKVVNVNLRIIAATNRDLRERIREGLFREDLYYRLNTLPLMVPPLRDRAEDVFPLLEHFLAAQGRRDLAFDEESRDRLRRYPWPGNIRELINVANYLSFMAGERVTAEVLPYYLSEEPESFEREEKALAARGGRIRAGSLLAALATGAAGRKALEETLSARGETFTEGEVRGLLGTLNGLGLVRSHPGRKGTELTARGRAYLNWLKKRG